MIEPLSSDELVLETARLILRPLLMEDLDLAVELFTDPDVMRHICDVSSPDEIVLRMDTIVRRGAGGRIGIWSVTCKDTGAKIGSCILLPVPITQDDTDWSLVVEDSYPDAEIEVGYFLVPSAWGQGFATEICQRLLQFGFENTSLKGIVATTDPKNAASQHVLEKCGLKAEGLCEAYATQCSFFRITSAQYQRMSS